MEEIRSIRMGDPADFRNFMTAVIDKNAFNSIKGWLAYSKRPGRGRIAGRRRVR